MNSCIKSNCGSATAPGNPTGNIEVQEESSISLKTNNKSLQLQSSSWKRFKATPAGDIYKIELSRGSGCVKSSYHTYQTNLLEKHVEVVLPHFLFITFICEHSFLLLSFNSQSTCVMRSCQCIYVHVKGKGNRIHTVVNSVIIRGRILKKSVYCCLSKTMRSIPPPPPCVL